MFLGPPGGAERHGRGDSGVYSPGQNKAPLFPTARIGPFGASQPSFTSRGYGWRLRLKMGSSNAKPIDPTTNPITVIMIGSIRLVAVLSAVSTS